ncbi:MAG TPA: PIN domain-containing protein [Nitrososphaeraceae archaeon]|nr:PIN domain-containing protein [Nitrososphaeraceae archaeon]
MIIIDTDVLIEISDRGSEKGDQIYQKIISTEEDIAITSVTLYETLYGLMKFEKPFYHLSLFHVYEFSKEDAHQAARLDLELEKKGKKIKRTKIIIASTTINKGATLCSFDEEFQELEEMGLRLLR